MSGFSYECSVCLDEQTETRGQQFVRSVGDDAYLCEDCAPTVVPLFEQAVDNELEYPPRWGGIEISLDMFKDLMSDELVANFLSKSAEYETPIQKRIYCQQKSTRQSKEPGREAQTNFCNTFIQGWSLSSELLVKCQECNGLTCTSCRQAISGLDVTHKCDTSSPRMKAEIYEKGARGKLWQRCPNAECGAQVELKDGCNAMTCRFCCEEFCFICGLAAEHDRLHWSEGNSCPRWNQPGAENANFDAHPDAVMGHGVVYVARGSAIIALREFNFSRNGDAWETGKALEDFIAIGELFVNWRAEQAALPPDATPKILLDFTETLEVFVWALETIASVVRVDHPEFEGGEWDLTDQTLAITNFWIFDERIKTKLRQAYDEAMQIITPGSAMANFPMLEVLDRYETVYWLRMAQRDMDFEGQVNARLATQQVIA